MPMKISLALGPRRTLSPQTAWGCLTTNVALPGFGSLLAGRRSGYPQAALALGGTALTVVCGVHFITWYVANWSHLQNPGGDPFDSLTQLWQAVRWPFLGIGLFALGWLWALSTSLAIVAEAKRAAPSEVPPVLH